MFQRGMGAQQRPRGQSPPCQQPPLPQPKPAATPQEALSTPARPSLQPKQHRPEVGGGKRTGGKHPEQKKQCPSPPHTSFFASASLVTRSRRCVRLISSWNVTCSAARSSCAAQHQAAGRAGATPSKAQSPPLATHATLTPCVAAARPPASPQTPSPPCSASS